MNSPADAVLPRRLGHRRAPCITRSRCYSSLQGGRSMYGHPVGESIHECHPLQKHGTIHPCHIEYYQLAQDQGISSVVLEFHRTNWGSDSNGEKKQRSSRGLMFRGLAQQPQAGAARPPLDLEPLIHQVAELPVFEPLVDQYRLHRLVCPDCGATTCGVMPPGVPTGSFGPRLQGDQNKPRAALRDRHADLERESTKDVPPLVFRPGGRHLAGGGGSWLAPGLSWSPSPGAQ